MRRMTERCRRALAKIPLLIIVVAGGAFVTAPGASLGPSEPFGFVATEELESGLFLIAGREMLDPNFAQTVVLLVRYSDEGALGVIVNRRSEIPVAEALSTIEEFEGRSDRLYLGGPVEVNKPFVLVRASDPPTGATEVVDDVYTLLDQGALKALLRSAVPEESLRVMAGYAGWAPGQLDFEVGRGDWRLRRASARWIFDEPPEEIWKELIRQALLPIA